MSKYIIDTDQFEKLFETKAVAVLGIGDNLAVPEEGEKTVWTRMLNVADLEELTSDYINEHFSDLQDTAYQKGLNDAWEAARKLFSSMADSDLQDTAYQKGLEEGREQMPCDTCAYRHNNLLCADCKWTYGSRYKVDSIGAGDVVIYNQKKWLVVAPETNERYASLFDSNGNHCSASSQFCQKTGEHYNINEILGGLSDD